jgi:amidase
MSLPLPEFDDLDATAMAALVASRELSAVELVDAAIARIEARNPGINAVVWKNYERARKLAAADPHPSGPFGGVPFLLKDLMAQDTGEPSTFGSRVLSGWRANKDAELVARYKRAGLIILGRTNTPEFGIYAVTEPELFGPARNPWDTRLTPGGSSGGSAAAVAARLVPVAHGGDGGGSIRIPAAHCGLVGMKPTRARNPGGPFAGDRWAGFVSEHVLARTVRDSAAMLDATHGPDAGAPYQVAPPARPFAAEAEAGARGEVGRLRIAFCREPLFGDAAHADAIAAVDDAARLVAELGHEVVEARPPFDREALIPAYFAVIATHVNLAVRTLQKEAPRRLTHRDFEAPTWLLRDIGENISAGEYAEAIQTIQHTGRTVAPFFEQHDVFLTATAARPPVHIGEVSPKPAERALLKTLALAPLKPALMLALKVLSKNALNATPNTMLFNMTGQPAVSLPTFWNAGGVPIGTQWVGRFGDEATLFRLAAQLESSRRWYERRPPITTTIA